MSYIKKIVDEHLISKSYSSPKYAIHNGKKKTLEEYTIIVQEIEEK